MQTLREDQRPHAKASLLLGQAYQQLNEHQQAKDMFLLAVKLAPDSAEACYGLAQTCARLKERDLSAEYIGKFQQLKAREETPDRDAPPVPDALQATRRQVAQTHTDAGSVYRSLGDLRQAERLWRLRCRH